MEEKRNEERSLCADLLKVRWRNNAGTIRDEYCTLEDISSSGACIQLEEAVAPGTVMTLSYPSGKFRARVAYCSEQGGVYLIGLAFEPGYCWSRSRYKPTHLLQFQLRAVRKQ